MSFTGNNYGFGTVSVQSLIWIRNKSSQKDSFVSCCILLCRWLAVVGAGMQYKGRRTGKCSLHNLNFSSPESQQNVDLTTKRQSVLTCCISGAMQYQISRRRGNYSREGISCKSFTCHCCVNLFTDLSYGELSPKDWAEMTERSILLSFNPALLSLPLSSEWFYLFVFLLLNNHTVLY